MPETETAALPVVSSVFVDRGLIAIRYMSSPASLDWPIAELIVPPELEDEIQLVAAPGLRPGILPAPGACCVAIVETPGVLQIAISPARSGGSLDAVIKVERLYAGMAAKGAVSSVVAEPIAQSTPTTGSSSVVSMDATPTIIAHVARRGDLRISPGEWVAGPSAPAAIEGLQLQPPHHGPDIELQALLAGHQGNWTRWVGPGHFVGSRGQARPLVGVRFRLCGPEAEQWTIAAEASFLGTASLSREGREIELVGPFATDSLVGLRIRVRANGRGRSTSAVAPAAAGKEQQIRIFRAGSISR